MQKKELNHHTDVVMSEKVINEQSVPESEQRQQVRLHELESSVTGMLQTMEKRFESSMEKLLVRVVEVSKGPSVKTKQKVGRATAPLVSPAGG